MIQVRPYRPADVPVIIALFRDTVRRINSRDYSPEQVRAWAPDHMDEGNWAARLAARLTLVAEGEDRIVGFGDLEADGHLDHLFVHADHQSSGVGRLLLTAVEASGQRQGIRRIFTEASITARPFFERQGYHILEEQVVVCRGVELVNYRMGKDL